MKVTNVDTRQINVCMGTYFRMETRRMIPSLLLEELNRLASPSAT